LSDDGCQSDPSSEWSSAADCYGSYSPCTTPNNEAVVKVLIQFETMSKGPDSRKQTVVADFLGAVRDKTDGILVHTNIGTFMMLHNTDYNKFMEGIVFGIQNNNVMVNFVSAKE